MSPDVLVAGMSVLIVSVVTVEPTGGFGLVMTPPSLLPPPLHPGKISSAANTTANDCAGLVTAPPPRLRKMRKLLMQRTVFKISPRRRISLTVRSGTWRVQPMHVLATARMTANHSGSFRPGCTPSPLAAESIANSVARFRSGAEVHHALRRGLGIHTPDAASLRPDCKYCRPEPRQRSR